MPFAVVSADVTSGARTYVSQHVGTYACCFGSMVCGRREVEGRAAVILAIAGSGAIEIGGLSQQRFGVDTPRACAATDVYVQGNDGDPATSDNTDPDGGKAFGVAVAYDCTLGAGSTARTISSLSLLLLGTRPNDDVAPQLEPHGLIVSEEVIHDPASLVAAGMAR
jgi:hypothetical protein